MAISQTLSILEVCKVSPSPPPPPNATSLPLTFFDLLWLTSPSVQHLLFFSFPENPYLLLPLLKHSLSRTLHYFYPLVGSLSWSQNPLKPIIESSKGDSVSLTIAESKSDFHNLVSDYPRHAHAFHNLVPHLLPLSITSIPLLTVQITVFPNNGLCIGFTVCHGVADGTTCLKFLKSWAALSRLERVDDDDSLELPMELLPFYDRSVIKDLKGLERIYLNDLERFRFFEKHFNRTRIFQTPPKMAAAAATTLNALFMSPPYTHTKQVKETKALASNLSRHLYTPGRVSGTGSNIGIKIHGDYIPKLEQLIAMSPSGFQERIIPEDMYTISYNGAVLSSPAPMGYPHKAPKLNDCAPIFMKADYLFDAVIKLHQFGVSWSTPSHGPMQNVKHSWCNDRTIYNRFVPLAMPNGNDALELSRRCILLDIEGTTTPISFVTDVLFPYARDNVRKHLAATYDSEETKDDIKLLRAQVEDDLEQGLVGVQPIPPDDAGKEEVITSLVANVEAMIRADRKTTSLKQLQGHIWRTGFQSDELKGAVFEDVPEALKKWNDSGIKVYIYSSGSRESQRLIFGKSNYGDLRKYLCGFFDTTIGNKRETRSYFEISQSVGVDSPSEILFLTDVYQEAVAAKAAGLEVIISIRPGNGPLPENHGFNTIESFSEV